jgi:hypothetical protein
MRKRNKNAGQDDTLGMPLADLLTTALGCILLIFILSAKNMQDTIIKKTQEKKSADVELMDAAQREALLKKAQDDFRKELEALKKALANEKNKHQQAISDANAIKLDNQSLQDQIAQAKNLLAQTQKDLNEIVGVTKEALNDMDPKTARPVDVMLVIDGTKSMKPSLDATRQNLNTTIKALRIVSPSARIGVTVFRDKLDDENFKLQYHPLTSKEDDLEAFLAKIEASSSKKDKDREEWICGGIKKATQSNWQKDVIKIIIIASDAGSQENIDQTCLKYAKDFRESGGQIHMLSTLPDGYEKAVIKKEYEQKVLVEHKRIAEVGGGQHIKNAQGSTLLEEVLRAAYQSRMSELNKTKAKLQEKIK